jgi:ParB-like chromosome segregation protein Spo0J
MRQKQTPLDVTRRNIETVVPPPWNARTDHDIEGIAASIRIHGMRDPIGVWATQDGKRLEEPHAIVEGSGRWRAVHDHLRWPEVDTIEHDFDSLTSAKAYAIAHNRYTDKSRFDDDLLLATLEELPGLDGTGFDLGDIEEIRGHQGPPDVEFPEYDESIEDDVEFSECPECGHKFPK